MFQPEEDSAAAGSSYSSCYLSYKIAISQWAHLSLMMLKLKSWWFLLLLLPFTALISFTYLPQLSKPKSPSNSDHLKFYGMKNLIAENSSLLFDYIKFKAEFDALNQITSALGWMKHCSPESKCRDQFIHEPPKVAAYLRFSETALESGTRSIAECFWVKESSLRCAFIYYLMVTAMQRKSLANNSEFKELELFSLRDPRSSALKASDETAAAAAAGKLPLRASVCSNWLQNGLYIFESNVETYVEMSLALSTISIGIYFIVGSTIPIRAIKQSRFLQQLFQNGLSVAAYWLVVWMITIIESLVFSTIFVFSLLLYCPSVFAVKNIGSIFFIFFYHCLLLAGIAFLLELLISSLFLSVLLMLMISLCLVILYSLSQSILAASPVLPFLFPPMLTKAYIVAQLTSYMKLKLTALGPESNRNLFYVTVIISTACTGVLLIIMIIYLDFLLKNGNGMQLPWYFPVCCRFWHPDKGHDDDTVPQAYKMMKDYNVERVTGKSMAIISDNISKAYMACSSCRPRPEVLRQISCLVYRDQVTAIVGHSGAGKTTLMNIFSGEEEPTSGVAYASGYKISDPLERLAARGIISVCLQTAPSNCLTTEDCIKALLISMGANVPRGQARARIMFKKLGERCMEATRTSNLSTSQRRKLSIVMALIAYSDIVLLDEPADGLDPLSITRLWALLHEEKQNRAIVVFTKSMYDTDNLADRNIILYDGNVLCVGSSRFLRHLFGCKFILTVTLKSPSDAEKLLPLFPKSKLKNKSDAEIELEFEDSTSKVEATKVLDRNVDLIKEFRVSEATNTDIFQRLEGTKMPDISDLIRSRSLSAFLQNECSTAARGCLDLGDQHVNIDLIVPSAFKRFAVMFVTNIKRQIRDPWRTIDRFVLPLLFMAVLAIWTHIQAQIYKPEGKMNESEILMETDIYSNLFYVKSQAHSDTVNQKIACLLDDGTDVTLVEKFCDNLLFNASVPGVSSVVIPKPKTIALRDFLSQRTTIERLRSGCHGTENVKPPCIVYYASSWNNNSLNSVRSLAIGVFTDADASEFDSAHLFRRAFLQIAKNFGAKDLRSHTALLHIQPFSQYSYFCVEVVLLFTIFNLIPSSFISDCAEDYTTHVRFQLAAIGMSRLSYWSVTFFIHWLQYLLLFSISASLLLLWDLYRDIYYLTFVHAQVLLLGTIANQFWVYVLAIVSKPSSKVIPVCYKIICLCLPPIIILLHSHEMMLFIPLVVVLPAVAPFAVGYFGVLYAIYNQEYYHTNNTKDIPGFYLNCLKNQQFIIALLMIFIHIVFFVSLLVVIEKKDTAVRQSAIRFNKDCNDIGPQNATKYPNLKAEGARLLQLQITPLNILEVVRLKINYPNGEKAVDDVTFGAMAGEILGLVESSGEGKTTLLSVLVGKEKPAAGICNFRNRSTSYSNKANVPTPGVVGYCPQHSPLYNCITVSEHLEMYASIQGLKSESVEKQISCLLNTLDLQRYQHSRVSELTAGEKRRLCLAIALLGNPVLIILDQATFGVDFKTKCHMQAVVRQLRRSDRAVLVATDRFEEVDGLCDRVGVINKGRMIYLGKMDDLRLMLGTAYTVDATMEALDFLELKKSKSNLKTEMAAKFAGTLGLTDCGNFLQLRVPTSAENSFLAVISWLDQKAKQFGVRSYTLRHYQANYYEEIVHLLRQCDEPDNSFQRTVQTEQSKALVTS